MQINWRQKLSSRKFWSLLAALFVAFLTMFKVDAELIHEISGAIMAVGACAIYMLSESYIDANRNNNETEEISD